MKDRIIYICLLVGCFLCLIGSFDLYSSYVTAVKKIANSNIDNAELSLQIKECKLELQKINKKLEQL